MQTNYQSLFLTTFTVPELKFLLRQELESFFKDKNLNSSNEEKDELLTIKEAASLLKYSLPSMYRLVNSREIPSLKKAGKILFSKEELIKWAEEGRRKTKLEIEEDVEKFLEGKGIKKGIENFKHLAND